MGFCGQDWMLCCQGQDLLDHFHGLWGQDWEFLGQNWVFWGQDWDLLGQDRGLSDQDQGLWHYNWGTAVNFEASVVKIEGSDTKFGDF